MFIVGVKKSTRRHGMMGTNKSERGRRKSAMSANANMTIQEMLIDIRCMREMLDILRVADHLHHMEQEPYLKLTLTLLDRVEKAIKEMPA
jgi:hypothetical protein